MNLTEEWAKFDPPNNGFDQVSKQAAAAYIGELLEALEAFANSKDMPFLARILSLAIDEAGRNQAN